MHKNLDPNDKRPVNLNLFSIKFPITAIVSILHRVSGFLLFLVIPVFLYFWQYSLENELQFSKIKNCMDSQLCKLLLWLILIGLFYHLIAGIRHILMDNHIGDSQQAGRNGAFLVITVTIVMTLLIGVYLYV